MKAAQLQAIENKIARSLDVDFKIDSCTAVSGGDINQNFKISCQGRYYFLKINSVNKYRLLESEEKSLIAIRQSGAIKVPLPICRGEADTLGYLLIEFLDLAPARNNSAALGAALAKMHRHFSDQFGWPENNFVGRTPQQNPRTTNWIEFWNKNRLGFQAKLAEKNNCPDKTLRLLEEVMQATPVLFKKYQPRPSLLHGDLWTGNAGCLVDGTPVIFDPACYYGDRETDIAMTELFGGFNEGFYRAYNASWPLDKGYAVRKHLYQLYHVVNHFNLFGGSYAAEAHRLCEKILPDAIY